MASSTSSRRQCSSHGAGQTRPRTLGNGMVRLKIRVDSREVALGVRLQEARDVDVAGALVLAGRQAVGVVVAEDQLEVGLADLGAGASVWVWTTMPGSACARAADRRVVLALDLDHAHPAGAEAGQLGLVAQGRDLDAVVAADLEDRLALAALDDRARRPRSGWAAWPAAAAATGSSSSRSAERLARGVTVPARLSGRALDAGRVRRSAIVRSSLGGRGGRHRDGLADAGRAGAAQEVVVELGPEVSHPGSTAGGSPAARGRTARRPRVVRAGPRAASTSVGRGRPVATRSPISASRRRPIRHGMVLPHASSAQKRVSSRARSTTQARSSATTTEPEPTCAPTARSASNA